MILIPAIDLKEGRPVRLLRGQFDRVTDYDWSPRDLASRYRSLGSRWIHCVDLDGARDGNLGNREIISELAGSLDGCLQVGGGIRDAKTVEALLDAGAGRIVIGSIAIEDPDTAIAWLDRYGADTLVLALDVVSSDDGFELVSRGWTNQSGRSLWDVMEIYGAAGVRHVLCTDVGRDGALTGPAVELYREFTQRWPDIELQASGGVRDVRDLSALEQTGASSAIVGRALLEGRFEDKELEPFLQSA